MANTRQSSTLTVAVVGNPNVGKTTLFNGLTGMSQTTGNYPGVTVERKTGNLLHDGLRMQLIDLPGTYSLAARSPDEMIVVDILLGQQEGERPVDAVLAVVDATNLERNLYLVSQLQELGLPLVIALNMADLAEKQQIQIDTQRLTEILGAPVIPVFAHKRVGIPALKEALVQSVQQVAVPGCERPEFPETLNAEIDGLQADLNKHNVALGRTIHRFEALRVLVDRGGYAEERLHKVLDGHLDALLTERRKRISETDSLAAIETRARYQWIHSVVAEGVTAPAERVVTASDRLDRFLTHPVYGTMVFVLAMAAIFQSIFNLAEPFMEIIEGTLASFGNWFSGVLPPGVLNSLITDGLIAGVGAVLVFLPQILILAFFIALLEDCGYMARAAYLMDKLLSHCGLSGHSFIPLLSSFACAIPGIMATRTISNRRDRFATILVAPLMSCSARLPVYSIMIAAFIPNTPILGGIIRVQGLTLLAMYSLGIIVAVPIAWILKKTLLRGETPPFLLELPTYKLPQWRSMFLKVWLQGREFLLRAGTTICAITVLTWALAYFPRPPEVLDDFEARRVAISTVLSGEALDTAIEELDHMERGVMLRQSYFGRIGKGLEFAFEPLGWDWRIGMATMASFPAREVVVATLGIIFNLSGDEDDIAEGLIGAVRNAVRPDGTPLFTISVALSLMVFFALCCQCGATLVIIRRETNSWSWPALTFVYMTVLAYVSAFLVYQIGSRVLPG